MNTIKQGTWHSWSPPAVGQEGHEEAKKNILACDRIVLTPMGWEALNILPVEVKAQNPDARRYLLVDADVYPDWDPENGGQMPIPHWEIAEHDLWLEDENEGGVFETPQISFLDPGKEHYKELWMAWLQHQIASLPGLDGVAVDYLTPDLRSGVLGRAVAGRAILGYPTGLDWWEKAWKPFLDFIVPSIKAMGLTIIGNNAGEPDERPESALTESEKRRQYQRSLFDGRVMENFALDYPDSYTGIIGFRPPAELARQIARGSKDPMAIWYASLLKAQDPTYPQKLNYLIAAYLMALPMPAPVIMSFSDPGNTAIDVRMLPPPYRALSIYGNGMYPVEPLLELDLGLPTEEPVQLPKGFWVRRFKEGIVALNASNKDCFLSLKTGYRDTGGVMVFAEQTVPPNTGLILRKE